MTALEFSFSIKQLSTALRLYALKLTKDAEDANDLVQETLFKAYANRNRFEHGTNLKAWLYTIMKNTFISNYKRMMRRNTFIDTSDNFYYLENESSSTHNEAPGAFVNDDIKQALDRLDGNHRTPFLMHFRGFKYQEIADTLNLPLGTVKNRIHVARKDLQDYLRPYAAA